MLLRADFGVAGLFLSFASPSTFFCAATTSSSSFWMEASSVPYHSSSVIGSPSRWLSCRGPSQQGHWPALNLASVAASIDCVGAVVVPPLAWLLVVMSKWRQTFLPSYFTSSDQAWK